VNFLAHCLLAERAAGALNQSAEDTQMLIAGGFIGDFLKGPVSQDLPPALGLGVRLHRRIDAYSNQNEAIRRSCNRFPDALRRLAPPLVDVVADHFLATAWHDHHEQPLKTFTQQTYQHISASDAHLPAHGQEFLQWMVGNDLLNSYLRWDSIERGMRSVTRRLRRQDLDEQMIRDIPLLLTELQQDFQDYFPEIQQHAIDWLSAEP
jgi:acyl carrier protein phosphodiesterase